MSADVVAFTPAAPHDGRAARAEHDYRAAYQIVENQARGAGWPVHAGSDVFRLFIAGRRLAELWKRRVAKLTKQLHAALATDGLSDEQRAEVVRGLTGTTRRDAKLLTATEREYLDALHVLSDADRAAVRRILRALSAAAETDGAETSLEAHQTLG